MLRVLRYLWALPTTLVGAPVLLLALLTRQRVRLHTGVIEISGPVIGWMLRKLVPLLGGASAMTLGHIVIARTLADHEMTRSHERVHVRQVERWGPLFIPAYFGSSLLCLLRGRDPYFDNAFEREAYGLERRGGGR
jgi:hypothetical protein